MNVEPEHARPTPPPPFQGDTLDALTLLLRLLHDISDAPVTDKDEFRREVEIRWRLWRDIEGWTLRCPRLGGYFELHLRESALGVRFFCDDVALIRMRILLNDRDPVTSFVEVAEGADASLAAAVLLDTLQPWDELRPLIRSLTRALTYRVSMHELLKGWPQ